MEFLRKYDYTELAERAKTQSETSDLRKWMCVMHTAIYQMRDLFASTLTDMYVKKAGTPWAIYATEGAAPLAFMLALGMDPVDILTRWSDGIFDVDEITFGKRRLPQFAKALHPREDGALHKGERLRNAIDAMLHQRFYPHEHVGILGKPHRMTLSEMFEKTQVFATYGAYSLAKNSAVEINHITYPNLPVSDAVLASMAAYPVLPPIKVEGEELVALTEEPIPKTIVANTWRDVMLPRFSGPGVALTDHLGVYWVQFAPISGKDREMEMHYRRGSISVPPEMKNCFHSMKSAHVVQDW